MKKVMNFHILNIVATLQLIQTTMMFVACFSKLRDVLDSQPTTAEPKLAIPDVFLHKFGLARTQSLKSFIQF